MNVKSLRSLLRKFRAGRMPLEEALRRLRSLPYQDLGFAKVDHHRHLRCGFPEVVFCQGKTPDQIVQVATRMVEQGSNLLATRATPEVFEAVRPAIPGARYEVAGRCITFRHDRPSLSRGVILILTAGTSDIPVAEEARVTAEMMDNRVKTLYDVGVAGIHRLLEHCPSIFEASVIIVAAGMEGALASVVGGLASCPVIAVPTSIGYGASFGGLAPLLTMLNSCAAGVSVVNIDNGFGAAYIASRINQAGERARSRPMKTRPRPRAR
ncbi:MAG: nickel pincer cofactor biosynthesis protein LarB [Planctomycetes bacterium]|nr:nickel pincer cofactor biosynthesis protein LarB [Planctomycetota bacterium]